MINENDIVLLRKCINGLNKKLNNVGPDKYFWCPMKKGNREGFTLYYNGGSLFSFYCDNGELCVEAFAQSYDKYFNDVESDENGNPTHRIGKMFFREKDDIERFKENVNALKSLTDDDFIEIDTAMDRWVKCEVNNQFKPESYNPNYERQRENLIANANCIMTFDYRQDEKYQLCNENIEIVIMEEPITLEKPLPNGHRVGKADLVGISLNSDDDVLISFIEYKCTQTGITQNPSLPEHYEDMHGYYKRDDVKKAILGLYNNKRLLYGLPALNIDVNTIKTDIVFLFSHITKEKTDGRHMYSGDVAGKILTMMNKEYSGEQFDDSDVKYMLLSEREVDDGARLVKNESNKYFSLKRIKTTNRRTKDRIEKNEIIRKHFE